MIPGITIIYRPRFTAPGGWFAWVRRHGETRLLWWPVSEAQAMDWYDAHFGRRYSSLMRFTR